MLSTDQFTSNEKRPKKSERKTEFKMTSTSECITWFAVFVTGSVIIASVNLLTIIVFLKNRNLRTRAMYLVINLTVADIFVGGISSIFLFEILGYHCQIVTIGSNTAPEGNITLFVFRWFPLTSLTSIAVISLDLSLIHI